MTALSVPFFRVQLTADEIADVVRVLESGWLTTGSRVAEFEKQFAAAVGAPKAVAVNSATAALHLGAEALGLKDRTAVLVPTMTFAATAEIVRYFGAHPILVDVDADTLNIDLADAEQKLSLLREGKLPIDREAPVVGIIVVHVGGLMKDIEQIQQFACVHKLWVIEDAAHAFPASMQLSDSSWRRCGDRTADVTCYSFYANKTITTGEGGMAVTQRDDIADRMRLMSLHGLSRDAWSRYAGGSWDYQIVAPGFKYNLTDIAAAIGIGQLRRADEMRLRRDEIAARYFDAFSDVDEVELPPRPRDRQHSWHLFPIKLRLERLSIDRAAFINALAEAGIGCSVHWRPLHLHALYRNSGWREELCPNASAQWQRLVSLPIFPAMTDDEIAAVINATRRACATYSIVQSQAR